MGWVGRKTLYSVVHSLSSCNFANVFVIVHRLWWNKVDLFVHIQRHFWNRRQNTFTMLPIYYRP